MTAAKRAVVALLALVCCAAQAFVPLGVSSDLGFYPSGGGITVNPSSGGASTWPSGGKVPGSGGMGFQYPSRSLPFYPPSKLTVNSTITPASMAKGLILSTVAIDLLLRPALKLLVDTACVRVAGGSMSLAPGGQWEECHLTNQTQYSPIYYYNTYHSGLYSSAALACAPYTSGPDGPYNFKCYNGATVVQAGYQVYSCNPPTPGNLVGPNSTPTACGTALKPDGTYVPSTAANAQTKVENTLNAWTQADFTNGYQANGNASTLAVMNDLMNSGATVDSTWGPPTVETPIAEPVETSTSTDPVTNKTTTTTTTTSNDYACTVIKAGEALSCSQYKNKTSVPVTVDNSTGTTTTGTTATTKKPGDPNAITCGLPGMPVCAVKVDEGGTPVAPTLKLDEASVSSQADTNRTTTTGTSDKSMFSGWSSLFVTPPVVACVPTTLTMKAPGVADYAASLDPCPVVGDVRSIMAWLWALAGFWVCLGFVRSAV